MYVEHVCMYVEHASSKVVKIDERSVTFEFFPRQGSSKNFLNADVIEES